MKRVFNFLFSIILLAILSCSSDSEQTKFELVTNTDTNGYIYEAVTNDPIGMRLYTLENGFKVYLTRKLNTTMVNSTIVVNAGTSFDPADNTGLAHYLEHALFEGTSKIGALDWEKEKVVLDKMAILYEQHKNSSDKKEKEKLLKQIDSLNYESSKLSIATEYNDLRQSIGIVFGLANTKPDKTRYYSKFPKTAMEPFLTLEAERFNEFIPRNFQNVLETVYEEFNQESDDVWEIKYEAIIEQLYNQHPYAISPIGIPSHLKNPSVKAAQEFFDTYYVPNNMAIILTGDFDFDNTIKMVDATFGKLKKKEGFQLPVLPKEKPITTIRATEISSQEEPCVYLGFRYENGVWSKNQKFISIIDKLLTNGFTGLFDEELIDKQRLSNVKTEIEKARDYGIHLLDGYPNKGQSLEEVESLLLAQLERIKQGDFDDALLKAVVNDIKLAENTELEDQWVGSELIVNSFLYDIPWNERLSYADEIAKINKQDIMEFAKGFYKNNYAVVYKRKGEKQNIKKVTKPKFTLPASNKDTASAFAQKIKSIPIPKLKPKFLDFKKDLKFTTLANGIPLSYVEKMASTTFEMDIVYSIGNMHNTKLKLAVSLWTEMGAGEKSAKQLKKELYNIGTEVDFYTENTRTILKIKGLQKNMNKSIALINDFLNNPTIEEETFLKTIEQTIENREVYKNSKDGILLASLYYGLFGKNSSFRDIIPLEQLKTINSQELLTEVKNLLQVEQEVFYHGNNHKDAINALNVSYNILTPLKTFFIDYKYALKESAKKVYFIDYKMSQAHIYFFTKGPKFDVSNWPYTNMLNFYYRYEYGDEIRRRALAYSAYAYHYESSQKDLNDTFRMFAATQVDKYDEALTFMEDIVANVPQSEERFKAKKENLLGRFESERIEGPNIFWTYKGLLHQDLDYDARENKYEAIKSMTLKEITDYHHNFIKQYGYDIVIIGDKSKIDTGKLSRYGEVIELTQDDLFGEDY